MIFEPHRSCFRDVDFHRNDLNFDWLHKLFIDLSSDTLYFSRNDLVDRRRHIVASYPIYDVSFVSPLACQSFKEVQK